MTHDQKQAPLAATDGLQNKRGGKSSSIASWIIDFISSIKLAVLLLIILAAVSIIGTVLAQGDSAQENVRFFTNSLWNIFSRLGLVDTASPDSILKYREMAQSQGLRLYELSQSLGFGDLYRTWYFNLLLALLSLNLIVCSLKHWPHTWRFFKDPKLILEGEGAAGIPLRKEIGNVGDQAQAAEKARAFLAKHGYKPILNQREGVSHLFGQKGLWGRLGVYLVHTSVLVIFLGAFIGFQWGKKGFVNIEEGQTADRVNPRGGGPDWLLPFGVRCNNFEVTYYENSNRPKDYKSSLTVIDGGREISTKVIEVNSPLIYQGIFFYQSSYGETGKAGRMKIHVVGKDGGKPVDLLAPLSEETFVAEYGFRIRPLKFIPDFSMNGDTVTSKSNELNNPAAALRLVFEDGKTAETWIFQRYPEIHSLGDLPFRVYLTGFDSIQYTGLQVTYDPGVNVIWLGCALMVLGIFVAFFMPHRRLWIKIGEGGSGSVWFAGSTNKNKPSFEEEFGRLAEELKESIASA